jgi:hypothetical protein
MKKSLKQTKTTFAIHMLRNIIIGLALVFAALYVGMCGYHFFEKMSWLDAFLNAAMILSGMGPVSILMTTSGKLFAGCYALFSGLMFIILMGILLSPSLHLIIRKIHLETIED